MDGSGCEALGGAQAGTPGAGVGGDLGGARSERRTSHEAQARVPSTDADGDLGRADAAAALGGKEALDDPVLERVVAEDHEAATGPEQVDGGRERLLEGVEVGVHRD